MGMRLPDEMRLPEEGYDGYADSGTLPVQCLGPGDHAWTCYEGRPSWDTMAAYIWTGLERNERVIVLPPPRIGRCEALARLEACGPPLGHPHGRGQLALCGMRELLLPDRRFTVERQWQRIQEETDRALAQRFSGLRTFIDMCWVADLGIGADAVLTREANSRHLFASRPYTEVCSYDRHRFSPAFLAAVHRLHPGNLLADLGDLRVQHLPDVHTPVHSRTVRLIGDADMATEAAWSSALRAALEHSAEGGRLTVDLDRLHFLSVACANDLLDQVFDTRCPRRIELRCRPRHAAMLRRLGAFDVQHVRLTTVPEAAAPGPFSGPAAEPVPAPPPDRATHRQQSAP